MSFLRGLFDSSARRAARDLDSRVRSFRAEVFTARSSADAEELARLRARPAALGLTDDDVALELEIVEGLLDVIALKEAAEKGMTLPAIATSHRALAGETCRYVAPASRPDAPNDPGGKLFFTDRRIVYLGSPSVTIAWAHVVDVRDVDRDLVVRVRPEAARTFRCNSYTDTLRGSWIASQILVKAKEQGPGTGARDQGPGTRTRDQGPGD